jgi:3',5'-cyclic AMP phosphodiesterase CpdA
MRRALVATLATLALLLSLTAGAALAQPAPPAADAGGFRVNPYLQNPSAGWVRITWFAHGPETGELVVRGPGLGRGAVYRTKPTREATLDYTEAELTQEIDGLEQGSWLVGADSYKHTVQVRGLRPGTTYGYTASAGGASYSDEFRTAPTREAWSSVRFIAMADSETEPLGRVLRREWAPGALAEGSLPRPSAEPGEIWDGVFGTTTLSGARVLRYALTEDEGFRRNLEVVAERDPDFLVMPGDLVQGGGYQPGWDEFFRHMAGETGTLLSGRAIIPAIGNWENFGALNGGYGTPEDRSPVVRSRAKYRTYFDTNPNGSADHQDLYHRVDYGPVTVITLDSSNGEPDDVPANYPAEEKATGQEYRGPGTDTQSNFTREEYEAAGGTDLADISRGSRQWLWAWRELADARARGQVIFVQFHHAPYSSGEHGVPMDHALTTGQGGTPMRVYHPLFERYGVVAVLSGHSEMFERSVVDEDGDGVGVQYYDVGVAGDGLRGEKRDGGLDDPLLRYNPFSAWTADQHEPERWELVDGVVQLVEGGKHYGHLEVDLERLTPQRARAAGAPEGAAAAVTLSPVHVFPLLDAGYDLVDTERRVYDDQVRLFLDRRGRVLPSS